MVNDKFDLFISHNSLDKSLIDPIAQQLYAGYDIRCWLDKWNLPAAADWEPRIQQALRSSTACAVVLGANGWGPHHLEETKLALKRKESHHDFKVIPILLPGANAKDIALMGDFFQRIHRVDFSNGMDDEEAFRRLLASIQGDAPGPPPMTVFSIRRDAERWKQTPNADKNSVLYSGGELREAQKIAQQHAEQLADLSIKFLTASATEEQRRIRADQKRTRKIIIGLATGVFILAVSSVIAFAQWRSAESRREEAELQTHIAEETTNIAQSQERIAQLRLKISEQDSVISNAQKEQAEIRAQIEDELKKIAEIRGRLEKLERLRAEREKTRADFQRDVAEERRKIALARQLAAQSDSTRNQNVHLLPLSLLLGIEGLNTYSTWEADLAIRNGLAVLPRQKAVFDHGENVDSVAISKDGDYLATTSGEGHTTGGRIKVWQMQDKKEIESLRYDGPGPVLFSPTENILAQGSRAGELLIRTVPSGRSIARLHHEVNLVRPVAFSPDGKRLAVLAQKLSDDATLSEDSIRIWTVADGKQIATIKSPTTASLLKLTFLDDHRLGAMNVGYVWDTSTGALLAPRNPDTVTFPSALSPNGKYLARIKPMDEGAEVVETYTGEDILKIEKEFLENAWFSPDSRYLVLVNTDGKAQIWRFDDEQGKVRATRTLTGIEALASSGRTAFSVDSRHVLFNSTEGIISIWDVEYGRLDAKLMGLGTTFVTSFSPDNKHLVTASSQHARLWEVPSRPEAATFNSPIFNDLSISADGERLATVSNREVRVWDLINHRPLPTLTHERNLLSVAINPNDKNIVATGSNAEVVSAEQNGVWLWKQDKRELLRQMDGHVNTLTYSPHGQYLAAGVFQVQFSVTASNDAGVWIWEAKSGREVLRDKEESAIYDLAFSPDERFITVSGLWSTKVLEVTSGATVFKWRTGTKAAAYSRDGKYLAIAGTGGADVYELKANGSPGRKLASIIQEGSTIVSVAFGPQSDYLATGSEDKTVRVWYLTSTPGVLGPREVTRINENGSPKKVMFTPDGNYLIAGSLGAARFWVWKPQDLLAEARRRVIRPLTQSEWRQYVGDMTSFPGASEPEKTSHPPN